MVYHGIKELLVPVVSKLLKESFHERTGEALTVVKAVN